MQHRRCAGISAGLFFWVVAMTGYSAEPDLKGIMQGLRDNVVEIADGLLVDDLDKVTRAANAIANHPTIPAEQVQVVAAELGAEMPAFKQFDTTVHDLSLEIAAAAESGDSAGAVAGFQQMLSGCFACHNAYKARVSTALAGAGD